MTRRGWGGVRYRHDEYVAIDAPDPYREIVVRLHRVATHVVESESGEVSGRVGSAFLYRLFGVCNRFGRENLPLTIRARVQGPGAHVSISDRSGPWLYGSDTLLTPVYEVEAEAILSILRAG